MRISELRGKVRVVVEEARPWRELAAGAFNDAPFYGPEWIGAYLLSFEPNANVVLVKAESESGLSAILPLVEKRVLFSGIPAKTLRGAANVHSCRFDLLRKAGAEGDHAVESVWRHLKQRTGWDVIELPFVPEDGAAEELMRLAQADGYRTFRLEEGRSPYVSIKDSKVAAEIPADSHFRANLRRRGRKARAKWEVKLRRIDRFERCALKQFYELENSGWKGQNKSSILCSPDTIRFYDEVASAGSQFGFWTLYLLDFGDRPVAGHFGLSHGGRYYCPKVAFDENFSAYGPGHLILEGIIQDIIDRGFTEFDFLGPWMDWKAEWTNQGRMHHDLFIFQRGIVGDTLYAAKAKAEVALRRAVRHYKSGQGT